MFKIVSKNVQAPKSLLGNDKSSLSNEVGVQEPIFVAQQRFGVLLSCPASLSRRRDASGRAALRISALVASIYTMALTRNGPTGRIKLPEAHAVATGKHRAELLLELGPAASECA